MSIKLISTTDLKTFLEEDSADFDTLLNQIIPQVSSQIETYLNRELKEEARTEYFSGGRRCYYVSAFPINPSPAPIVLEDDVTQTENEDFFTFENEGLFEFQYETSKWRPKIIKITWTGGYAEATGVLAVPDDMKQACIQQCAYVFKRRRDLGNSGVSSPNGSINYTAAIDLLVNVKTILNLYRNNGTLI
jgi:hypothetical protein